MCTIRRAYCLVILVFAATAFTNPVQAQSISLSASFSLATGAAIGAGGADTAILSFDQFDPTLGPLTGVQIDLGTLELGPSRFRVITTVNATGTLGSFLASAQNNTLFSVSQGGSPLFARNFVFSAVCTGIAPVFGSASCTDTSDSLSQAFSATQNVDPLNFSDFIGTGTVDLLVQAAASPLAISTSGAVTSVTASSNVTWAGPIGINYQYVPVPGALLLMLSGLGIGGLAMIGRRKTQ